MKPYIQLYQVLYSLYFNIVWYLNILLIRNIQDCSPRHSCLHYLYLSDILPFSGRWTRVEDPCVPENFVLHFLARILDQTDQVILPHSVKYLSHRGLPYKRLTQKVSYRVYDLVALQMALEEQNIMKLCQSAAFRYHEKLETAENTKSMTMKEKIARMKASANARYSQRTELPTSRSSLVVLVGEGHCS